MEVKSGSVLSICPDNFSGLELYFEISLIYSIVV